MVAFDKAINFCDPGDSCEQLIDLKQHRWLTETVIIPALVKGETEEVEDDVVVSILQ